jgi:hypothetical protein
MTFNTPFAKTSLLASTDEKSKNYYQYVCPARDNTNFVYLSDSADITNLRLTNANSYDVNATNLIAGRPYDFLCTYGTWNDTLAHLQYHRIVLNNNYQLIASGSEPPVNLFVGNNPIRSMNNPQNWNQYGWYVSLKDGKLKFQVKTVSTCTSTTSTVCIQYNTPYWQGGQIHYPDTQKQIGSCLSYGHATQTSCTGDNQCPVYKVGALKKEVYSWSGINCTVLA